MSFVSFVAPEILFDDDDDDVICFFGFETSSSAVPNGFVQTQQKFASRSLSGTQYDGRAESLMKSEI